MTRPCNECDPSFGCFSAPEQCCKRPLTIELDDREIQMLTAKLPDLGIGDIAIDHAGEPDRTAMSIVIIDPDTSPHLAAIRAALFHGMGHRSVEPIVIDTFPDGAQYMRSAYAVNPPRIDGKSIEELIAASSIGGALEDIRTRGIEAHLAELEREFVVPWPRAPRPGGRQRNRKRWRKKGRR